MALRSELAGAGPLEELLRQERVTDVLVNGPDSVGLIVGRGWGGQPSSSAMSQPFAAWPSDWRRAPIAASMKQRRTSMPGCQMALDFTRSCRR